MQNDFIPLSAEAIGAALPGLSVRCYDAVDSTNTEAKRLLKAGLREPVLLVAEEQTAGRGRQGKSFFSPRGTGLYLTLVVFPNVPPESAVHATTAASVAVCRAIRQCTGTSPQIKWVNDLYLDERKCCGILVEAQSDRQTGLVQSLVIGVGVNLSTQDFPDELARTAASLGNAPCDRNALAAAIAAELLRVMADLDDTSWMEDYRHWSLVLGRDILYWRNGEQFAARALEIEENGALRVQHPDGSQTLLQSGEISLRLN